jgi:hypothetical protein
MNKDLARLACSSIFLAMFFMSCNPLSLRSGRRHGDQTNIGDSGMDGGVKQVVRRRIFPVLVLRSKFKSGEMTSDTCHRHRRAPPWWSEIKDKRVVLDKLGPRVMLICLYRVSRT